MVDTMIRLHEHNSTDFDAIGIGVLPDAMMCEVVEERNGQFELEMTYSVEGRLYSELMLRRLIVAKPNPFDDPQPFRIYDMSKPINGIVTVRAEHISYDLSGYTVKPFEATSIGAAMVYLKSNCVVTCPFNFESRGGGGSSSSSMLVDRPSSIRSLLGGTEGSILDEFGGGEYEFNRYNVTLWSARGENRGVTIRYGKNLMDLEQEENCSNVYTHVYPYYFSDESGLISLPEYVVSVPGTYNYTKILPLDLSDKFEEPPTEPAALRAEANKYISNNSLGSPDVSLNVSFVQLAQSEEYKDYALLETVHLCDTVTVEFPKLGVNSTAKCIKTVYDVLTGKYTSIELGNARTNLASTVAQHNAAVKQDVTKTSVFKEAVQHATKLITGGLGGYVVLHSTSGGETPDEILIMDEPTISAAHNIWRWNSGGLGHSKNGYNGEFSTAMTADGQIVADRITTGNLNAGLITTGRIQSENGRVYFDLDNNELACSKLIDASDAPTTWYKPGTVVVDVSKQEVPYGSGTRWYSKLRIYKQEAEDKGISIIPPRSASEGTTTGVSPTDEARIFTPRNIGLLMGTSQTSGGDGYGIKSDLASYIWFRPTNQNNTQFLDIVCKTPEGFRGSTEETSHAWAYISLHSSGGSSSSLQPPTISIGGYVPSDVANDGPVYGNRAKLHISTYTAFWSTTMAPISGSTIAGLQMNPNEGMYYIGTTSASSRRYKHDIDLIKNEELDPHRLYQVPIRQFVYNEDYLKEIDEHYGKVLPGFITEELDEYYPIAVQHNEDGTTENWYERLLIPPMLRLIQEQHEQIEELSARVNSLECRLCN